MTVQTLDMLKPVLDMGGKIIPLLSAGEDNQKGGKRPRLKNWQDNHTSSLDDIQKWYDQWTGMNLGLLVPESGLVVVDIDSYNGANIDDLCLTDSDKDTPTVRTANGGLQLFYLAPTGLTIPYGSEIYPAIELPRMVVIPPSIVKAIKTDNELRQYQWLIPPDKAIKNLPETVLGLIDVIGTKPPNKPTKAQNNSLHPYISAILQDELAKLAQTGKGNRNRQLLFSCRNVANFLGQGGLTRGMIESEFKHVAGKIGLPDSEVETTMKSGIDYGMGRPRQLPYEPSPKTGDDYKTTLDYSGGGQPEGGAASSQNGSNGSNGNNGHVGVDQQGKEYALTEFGNAERFADQHGGDLRFCFDLDSWLHWDGKRWVRDKQDEVYKRAKETIRGIYREASQATDSAQRKELAKWAIKSETKKMTRNMVDLGRAEGLSLGLDEFDQNRWLLNCQNGTINLQTSRFFAHTRQNYLTKIVQANYDPMAKCPKWINFLGDIFGQNGELIAFVQRAIGYTFTGDVSGQCFFFCHGHGANGKSVFMETLQGLMGGDYSCSIRTESLMLRDKSRVANNDIAKLRGARLVTANETNEGQRLDESLIKQITGKDTVTARFLYGEEFDFMPEFKLWIRGNHKPKIEGVDDGIWRRVMFIPFSVTIPQNKRDPYLPDRLKAEYDGILAWAMRGLIDYMNNGLNPPGSIEKANQEYRQEMDDVGQFLDEFTQPGEYVTVKNLYDRYETWCYSNGSQPRTKNSFGRKMTSKGFNRERHPQTKDHIYRGISLSTN